MGVLPTGKRKPQIDLHTLNVLIYGDPGIGKSTTASQAPDVLFFATEDGLKSLEVAEYPCSSWEDVEAGVQELEEQAKDSRWKTIVIDTVDNFYLLAADKICRQNQWDHEADGNMGKGYGMIRALVKRTLNRISAARAMDGSRAYGLWLISHAKDIELDDKSLKAVPSLTESTRKDAAGYVDLILFMDVEGTEDGWRRVLRTKPSRRWIAKDRTGRLPEILTLPEQGAYQMLEEALGGSESPPEPQAPPQEQEARQATAPAPEPGEAPEKTKPEPGQNGNGKPECGQWARDLWKKLAAWSKSDAKRKDFLTQQLREIGLRDQDPKWSSEWIDMANKEGIITPIHRKMMEREVSKKLAEAEKFKNHKKTGGSK